jgi:hypothetical protein
VTVAACAMGLRRRGFKQRHRERIFTGFLWGRKRAHRGQAVLLPDGTLGFVYVVQRGKVAIWRQSPFSVGEEEHLVFNVSDLRRYKLPSAVLLGSLKAGVVERPSARKGESCRRNGCRPCHEGRYRGRPKKLLHAADGANTGATLAPAQSRPPVGDFAAAVEFWTKHGSSQQPAGLRNRCSRADAVQPDAFSPGKRLLADGPGGRSR